MQLTNEKYSLVKQQLPITILFWCYFNEQNVVVEIVVVLVVVCRLSFASKSRCTKQWNSYTSYFSTN